MEIKQHRTIEERRKAATGCSAALKLTMPLLVDDMENSVDQAFHGSPDRLFILSPDGTIAYRGDRGPRGFDVAEMTAALTKLVAKPAKP